ncbi:hypothetical protein Leryth_018343, partial [Lithospermum erythrorhizon]
KCYIPLQITNKLITNMKAFESLHFLNVLFIFALFSTNANAAHFEIRNNCRFTVWAAAVPTGGGKQLNSGQTWNIDVPTQGLLETRIWAPDRIYCGPTYYSRFFKTRCPDAYSYLKMIKQVHLLAIGGTNYRVVFCP